MSGEMQRGEKREAGGERVEVRSSPSGMSDAVPLADMVGDRK